MENPPLWVWAIIVGGIIVSKFIYRWQSTKYFAKESEEGKRRRINADDKTKDLRNNEDFYNDINNRCTSNISGHKYSTRHYYKDYFAIKKKKTKKNE